jgi:hypothetical protein
MLLQLSNPFPPLITLYFYTTMSAHVTVSGTVYIALHLHKYLGSEVNTIIVPSIFNHGSVISL